VQVDSTDDGFNHWTSPPVSCQQLDDLPLRELQLPGRQHELCDLRLDLRHACGQGAGGAGHHGHRAAAVVLEQAFGLQQRVGLRDRHRIHGMLPGEVPHGRQRVARHEPAARNEAACSGRIVTPRHDAGRLQADGPEPRWRGRRGSHGGRRLPGERPDLRDAGAPGAGIRGHQNPSESRSDSARESPSSSVKRAAALRNRSASRRAGFVSSPSSRYSSAAAT
jgi:hypothetical protein